MRRVVFMCPRLHMGGVERLWIRLLPALARRGLGIHVVVLEPGGKALDRLIERRVPVTEFDLSGVSALSALPRLLRKATPEPDAIVTNGFNADALGAVWGRASRIPHLVNWHRQPQLPMTRRQRLSVRLVAATGAGVIAVTTAQVKELQSLGFGRMRIAIIPNGVHSPDLGPEAIAGVRRQFELDSEAFVAVLVARLEPEKRVDDFLEAMRLLSHKVPDVVGLVVGSGSLEAELRDRAARSEAPVRFVGLQDRPTDLMLASDVVCLTSDFEALPMALVEAQSCARPTVATEVGGTSDIIASGETGFLVPPHSPAQFADALRALASDRAKARSMGVRALEHWRAQFAFEPMVERYFRVLTSADGPPTRVHDSGYVFEPEAPDS